MYMNMICIHTLIGVCTMSNKSLGKVPKNRFLVAYYDGKYIIILWIYYCHESTRKLSIIYKMLVIQIYFTAFKICSFRNTLTPTNNSSKHLLNAFFVFFRSKKNFLFIVYLLYQMLKMM